MTRRRQVLRGFFGIASLAALGNACGPIGGAPTATPRKYRIGLLSHRVECMKVQVTDGVGIKIAESRFASRDCADTDLLEALENVGYVQGENLAWIVASPATILATGVADLAGPALQLVTLRVDLIVTRTANATVAAQQATTTIPIVIANVADIVDAGLVSNLAHPGGNITGLSGRVIDVATKRIELLREAFPRVKSPILVYGNFGPHLRAVGPAVEAARQLGLDVVAILLTADGADFAAKAQKAFDEGADSLVAMGTPGSADQFLPFVRARRLPAVVGQQPEFIDAGGTIGFGYVIEYASFAGYVDRILKGAKPGDLPIVAPTTTELVVNLSTADAFGLSVAPSVVSRATRVIH